LVYFSPGFYSLKDGGQTGGDIRVYIDFLADSGIGVTTRDYPYNDGRGNPLWLPHNGYIIFCELPNNSMAHDLIHHYTIAIVA